MTALGRPSPLNFYLQVKWADTYDGYGEHYWEYNHSPKYPEHDTYKAPAPVYSPEPSYGPPKAHGYPSENVPVIISDPQDLADTVQYSAPRE